MDRALVVAHERLDLLVDKAFGATRKLGSKEERVKLLFDQYASMTPSQKCPRGSFTACEADRVPIPGVSLNVGEVIKAAPNLTQSRRGRPCG